MTSRPHLGALAVAGEHGRAAVQRSADPVLSSRNLSLTYQTKQGPLPALSSVNITIGKGEFVSIVGPSGCGKSSFLKITAGLIAPTEGTVELHGSPIRKPGSDIGVVFQKANLLPWKTVIGNSLIYAQTLKMDRQATLRRATELLRMVGLDEFHNNYPGELSGGMQQRVGIVRALVHDPELLLMDEPFAALDAMTREQMALDLQDIWNSATKSIVFITHSIPEAVLLSDRVLVMSSRPGRIIDEVEITLPRPREVSTMASIEFVQFCNHLRQCFSNVNENRNG